MYYSKYNKDPINKNNEGEATILYQIFHMVYLNQVTEANHITLQTVHWFPCCDNISDY